MRATRTVLVSASMLNTSAMHRRTWCMEETALFRRKQCMILSLHLPWVAVNQARLDEGGVGWSGVEWGGVEWRKENTVAYSREGVGTNTRAPLCLQSA